MRFVPLCLLFALLGCNLTTSQFESPPPEPMRMVYLKLTSQQGIQRPTVFAFTTAEGAFTQVMGQAANPDVAFDEKARKYTISGRIDDIQPNRVNLTIHVDTENLASRQGFTLDNTLIVIPGQEVLLRSVSISGQPETMILLVYVIPGPGDPEAEAILKLSSPTLYQTTQTPTAATRRVAIPGSDESELPTVSTPQNTELPNIDSPNDPEQPILPPIDSSDSLLGEE